MVSKVKDEWYKAAYNKLYGFLRRKHPEVLEEYRNYLQKIKDKLEHGLLILETE